jgi:hypothetical protein
LEIDGKCWKLLEVDFPLSNAHRSALRTAVEYFENLDNPDFGVATLHRVGLVLIQKGDYKVG